MYSARISVIRGSKWKIERIVEEISHIREEVNGV